jgi:Fe-S-cluster containining protein
VWVNQAEIDALAEQLGVSSAEFERRFVRDVGVRRSLRERRNYDCVLLDPETRKCTVYEARPRQCRTWPFWHSNLRSPEAWRQTCEVCPGSGQGKLHSIETIERQAAEVRV